MTINQIGNTLKGITGSGKFVGDNAPTISSLTLGNPLTGANGGTGTNNGSKTINLNSPNVGYVLTSDASGNASWQAVGTGSSVLLSPSGNQSITAHDLAVVAGQVVSGTGSGGFQGTFVAYSNTVAKGNTVIRTIDNVGNYSNVIQNASTTAARTWTFPDNSGTVSLTGSGARIPTQQQFTSGTGTYTTPAGVAYIIVEMAGGGGGGGGSYSSTPNPGNGSAGGNTTFGSSFLTANGGGVGDYTTGAGGAGGTASLASPAYGLVISGGGGSPSMSTPINVDSMGGATGGSNALGGAGSGGASFTAAAGNNGAANTGAGGGGGGIEPNGAFVTISGTGGGAGGYLRVIVPSPSANYGYAVGSGGSGGSAGGNGGQAGGNGGSGIIIVTEYYQ